MKNSARRNMNYTARLADCQINEPAEQGALALNGESHLSLARVPSLFEFRSHDGLRFKKVEGCKRRGGGYWIVPRRALLKRIYPGTLAGVAHLEQMMMARRTAKIEGRLSLLPIDVNEFSTSWQDAPVVTKFFVPTLSREYLSRPRLTTLLNEGLQRKLTLVSAPAGFGKTTLASAWASSLANGTPQARVAWITLDRSDNDPRRFWTVFLTALEQSAPGSVQQTLALLCTQPSLPLTSVLITLINQLVEINTPQVVILDDYQVINEPVIHEQLSFLQQHQPPSLHLLLLSRTNPPLSQPRLRGRNEILELRAEHLRFTQEETRAFVRDVMGSKLPEEIVGRAEGWVTGLHLLDLCIQGAEVARAEEVRGSHRYILDYLVEEVLQQQPHAVQQFLLRTSILEQFCAPLCDAVIGKAGSQNILHELEDANVFIVPLDGNRYRYHVLFAEALRAQLERQQADEVEGLHMRASAWHAEQGSWHEAIQHALLAHAWSRAADLVEQVCCSISWQEGLQDMVSQWLDQIPEECIRTHPRLEQLMRHLVEPRPILHPDVTHTSLREQTSSASDGQSHSPDPLSTRELEVLQLMAKGSSNRDIAERLVITVDTVKRHVSNILGKLQTSNRTQAVVQAHTFGLVDD